MKVVMMGSGGVGGYLGARLAQGGCDVTFVARGAHLAALLEHGLTVESPVAGAHLPRVHAIDDPASAGPVDVVVVAVKLWDTEAAARAIAPVVGPRTAVVSFQNGVQRDDVLRRWVGDAAVMGGVAYIAASIVRPGVIRHTGTMQRFVFGEYDGRRSERAEALLGACRRGGVDAEVSGDIRKTIWEKFAFLAAFSGVTAAARLPVGPIRTDPAARALLLDAMREAAAVGRAQGVALDPDYAERRLAFCDGLAADMTSSMHHDLEQGNRLEVAWLSGAVAEMGQAAGIATPVNGALAAILSPHARGRER